MAQITVRINGKDSTLEEGTSVAAFLASRNLQPVSLAVELNRSIVPKSRYAEVTLAEGDALEIVSFVGGG